MTMPRKRIRAVLLSVLLVGSVAAIPMAGALASGTTVTKSLSNPTTYQATDQVAVWERAGLPLRADTDNAAERVKNPHLFVNYTGEISSANKNYLAVYDTSDSITLNFGTVSGADTSKFGSRDAQLVIAHLEPNASTDLSDISTPANLDELRNLLTTENANSNASFRVLPKEKISGTGSMSTSFTPQEGGGVYVTFLATNSTGKSGSFSATSGDLSVSGNVTI
ncbi:MAG: hypothetical protein ABEI52_03970, partial [Halobacteriaceae archaeon]